MSNRKRTFSHPILLIVILAILLSLLFSCGRNDNSGSPASNKHLSNKYLEVYIDEPIDGSFSYDKYVILWGSVSTEEHYSYDNCPLQQNANIVVTWENKSSGATGSAYPFWQRHCADIFGVPLNCYCFQCWWEGEIYLTPGVNIIEATAIRETQSATHTHTVTREQLGTSYELPVK